MLWDDLADTANNLFHIFFDFFYSIEYIFSNLSGIFVIIFTPLNFAFNFVKGFFDGINTTPPATAISFVFEENVLGVFDAIPYWDLFSWGIGAGLSIIILGWIMGHLLKL